MNSLQTRTATWTYWRPAGSEIVELASVQGSEVGLPAHFHAEDQFTFVLAGQRRFVIGERVVVIRPGEGTWITAGTPHSSLQEPGGLVCFNLYLPANEYGARELLAEMRSLWRSLGRVHCTDIADAVLHCRMAARPAICAGEPMRAAKRPFETVAKAALQAGMSREGFSRKFRRSHGMSPRDFSAMRRLNDARELLRGGEPVAAVAAETGFADQSHLGRFFRRAFGVTPGQYRSTIAVTNVPDRLIRNS